MLSDYIPILTAIRIISNISVTKTKIKVFIRNNFFKLLDINIFLDFLLIKIDKRTFVSATKTAKNTIPPSIFSKLV